jgi:hypothetical protein
MGVFNCCFKFITERLMEHEDEDGEEEELKDERERTKE